ncbi:MAG: TlpA family protein disulfide reductase [Bacteroidaceae bacterium]|nr:TlpA family protein disulfide reductase [Bacteroidaceae bacterium]
MKKRTLLAIALLLAVLTTGQAKKKSIVWEEPTTEYGTSYGDGFFNTAIDVTKVELKKDETVVYITVSLRSDYPDFRFQFVGDTYLKAGEQRYALVSADGIELDTYVQTDKEGKRDIAFHFQPLPQDTKSFDFIEGDGERAFQIKGIKPVEERWKQLFPSYWRNGQGDWTIAFLEDCAIYDCKFWNYKQCDVNPKTGEAEMTLSNGNKELEVVVGKNKKGARTIQIGTEKALYSMITSRFMPDYPTKDTRTDFVNTGYKVDTVTVVGWIKDMPEQYKKEKTFEFSSTNLFTDEQESVYADLDEQGRFTAKIPVLNSSEFTIDWRRCFIRTMFEPGKTYFLLYDFKEGRRYFMGDDCRLQNELFRYPLDWKSVRLEKRVDNFDPYMASADSLIKAQYASIDELCQVHPTLSTRFNKFKKGHTLMMQAGYFGQARFGAPDRKLPENARRYAYDTFWTKMEHPYTLHGNLRGFLTDYINDMDGGVIRASWDVLDHIDEIASNEEELAVLNRYKKWYNEAMERINAAPSTEEKQRIAEELNSNNAELLNSVDKILNGPQVRKFSSGKFIIERMKTNLHRLDSLQADPLIKDLILSQMVNDQIDNTRTSLLPKVIDTLKALVNHPYGIELVEKSNNRYLAIENREFNKLVLKSSDHLAGISEGEVLLKKIIEPFKGKFVLLDIWGTWCGPCKEALSHSTEEYARLKDYDIEFLYLANESPKESWENVIKEYNVSGDNVTHYNLPREQQSAIESYLGINAYPTYKLFDREGNLLDIKVDARNLDYLESLLQSME